MTRDEVQAQRTAALRTIRLEQVLRQVLSVLDPQADDAHLDYAALLQRVQVVIGEERQRLQAQEA